MKLYREGEKPGADATTAWKEESLHLLEPIVEPYCAEKKVCHYPPRNGAAAAAKVVAYASRSRTCCVGSTWKEDFSLLQVKTGDGLGGPLAAASHLFNVLPYPITRDLCCRFGDEELSLLPDWRRWDPYCGVCLRREKEKLPPD